MAYNVVINRSSGILIHYKVFNNKRDFSKYYSITNMGPTGEQTLYQLLNSFKKSPKLLFEKKKQKPSNILFQRQHLMPKNVFFSGPKKHSFSFEGGADLTFWLRIKLSLDSLSLSFTHTSRFWYNPEPGVLIGCLAF